MTDAIQAEYGSGYSDCAVCDCRRPDSQLKLDSAMKARRCIDEVWCKAQAKPLAERLERRAKR